MSREGDLRLQPWGLDATRAKGRGVAAPALADPYVICDTRWYGTGRESSVPIDAHQADVCEFRDGKVIRVTLGYATTADALEALGLAG